MVLMSSPEVEARVWMARSGVKVRLLPSFIHFQQATAAALALPLASRLYWLPTDSIADRRRIADDETFQLFRDEWAGGQRPIVWAYPPPVPGAPASPEELPFAPAEVHTPAPPAGSSVGTRDSRQQREFRASLESRDGKDSCVACGHAGPTEAAHIIRHRASPSLVRAAGLHTAWDVRNGVMLCHTCHLYFDTHFWCVGEDGKVVVAEALLADEDCERHFHPLVGLKLRHSPGDSNWPTAATWRCQAQQFLTARAKRHEARAEREFMCEDCGSLFKRDANFRHHVKEKRACDARLRHGKKLLWTPAEKLAFPELAAADEGVQQGGVARRLSLVAEGDAAAAGGGPGGAESGDGASISSSDS